MTRYYPLMVDLRGRRFSWSEVDRSPSARSRGCSRPAPRHDREPDAHRGPRGARHAGPRPPRGARLSAWRCGWLQPRLRGDRRSLGRAFGSRRGAQRGVWVNAADDPAHCDFVLPAVLRRGPLTVSVAHRRRQPGAGRRRRDELARPSGEEYGPLAELVADVRRELRARGRSPDGETWRRALDADAGRARRPSGGTATPDGGSASGWGRLMRPGVVALVGAGPGDPGLLTVRGPAAAPPGRRRRLRPPGRSPRAGAGARRRASDLRRQGERPAARCAQDAINALLIAHAASGPAGGAAQRR